MQDIDYSPVCEKDSEKIESQGLPHESENEHGTENGENTSGMGEKLALDTWTIERFPGPTMAMKRKTRQKDEGPLEIVCGWIVEHQIGRRTHSLSADWRLTLLKVSLSISSCF